ncbi:MAG: PAS domain S-box protein, partial [Limnothrix sp.]
QVLLLENSGQDSAILMHLLEPPQTIDLSFQVTQVDGLEVALSQLAAHTYDLLLVDLNLPETQGLTTFAAIKPFCAHVPIVLLVQDAIAEKAIIQECLQQGAQDYLLSTLCLGESLTEREWLMCSIRHAIETHRVQAQLQQQMMMQTELVEHVQKTDAEIKTIFEAIAEIVLIVDPETWLLQSVTTPATELEAQIIQSTVAFLQEQRLACQQLAQQAIATDIIIRHEYQLQFSLDNLEESYWFTAKISPINQTQVLWIAHDITPIKQAQAELFAYQQELEDKVQQRTQELRQEQEFLSTMFDVAGALLLVLDPQGQIVRFNPTCEALMGYTEGEVLGKYIWDLFLRPEDVRLMRREWKRLLRQKTSIDHEVDWRSKQGQLYRISWSHRVLLNQQGKVRYVIAAGMDVSDRQTLEMTLKTLNQELEARVEQRTNSLKQIQQNLRRQLAAVDAAVEAIAILQQGKFVSVNSAFLDLFGYPHLVSLSEHSWEILFAPEEETRIATEIVPQLHAQYSWQGQAIARRQDGSTFTQEVSLTITPDQDLICVCRDITRKEADAAKLRLTQTLLRSQYDNFPIPTYTWQHRGDDFYLVNFNAAADATNDHQLNEFVGRTSHEIYGRNHAIHRNIMTCFETKKTFEAELPTQYRAKKQRQLLLRYLIVTYVYIEPNMVMIHTQDLTERKRAETELKQNQSFLRQVIDNDPNLIFVKDGDGRFLLANQAIAALYGTTVEDLVGKTDADFNPELAESQQFVTDDRRAMISQETVFIPEEAVTDHTGQTHYFRTVKIPLKLDHEEHFSRVLGVAADITQLRNIQLQLEQALAQERELNLLKTSFIDTASHEFRTPLTVILGATDILENHYEQIPVERRERHLQNIQTNARRIQDLIDDMLSMSRLDAGTKQCDRRPINIQTLCNEILEEMQLGVGKAHQLKLLIPQKIPQSLSLDPDLVRQILNNLLANACKYSPTNSLVTLKATYHNQNSNVISFAVQDQGIGIPPEDQHHLFESFYRAGNVHTIPGTGLGLNIVQKYVQIHGGTIGFVSELNSGSTFTVRLPIPLDSD